MSVRAGCKDYQCHATLEKNSTHFVSACFTKTGRLCVFPFKHRNYTNAGVAQVVNSIDKLKFLLTFQLRFEMSFASTMWHPVTKLNWNFNWKVSWSFDLSIELTPRTWRTAPAPPPTSTDRGAPPSSTATVTPPSGITACPTVRTRRPRSFARQGAQGSRKRSLQIIKFLPSCKYLKFLPNYAKF